MAKASLNKKKRIGALLKPIKYEFIKSDSCEFCFKIRILILNIKYIAFPLNSN